MTAEIFAYSQAFLIPPRNNVQKKSGWGKSSVKNARVLHICSRHLLQIENIQVWGESIFGFRSNYGFFCLLIKFSRPCARFPKEERSNHTKRNQTTT